MTFFVLYGRLRSILFRHLLWGIWNAFQCLSWLKMLHWRGVTGVGCSVGAYYFCGTLLSLLVIPDSFLGIGTVGRCIGFTCTYHLMQNEGTRLKDTVIEDVALL